MKNTTPGTAEGQGLKLSDFSGLLTLALIPFYVLWAVWVLVPYWMVRGFIRYYRAPLKVRQRRWRIEHSNRTRYFEKYEREVAEILRGWGVIDTPTNRLKYAKSIEKALARRRRKIRPKKRSQ